MTDRTIAIGEMTRSQLIETRKKILLYSTKSDSGKIALDEIEKRMKELDRSSAMVEPSEIDLEG